MTKKEIRDLLICRGYNLDTVKKALAKTERWMAKAFGRNDWEEARIETVEAFCKDSLKHPDGKKTFNRGY